VSLTRAILELARGQGLVAVAEGVETAGQADLLRELDCPLSQGYHFGRPADAVSIGALLGAPVQQAAA
jgi:EAL domain-containing protein (putative c-di-GMP-specific phosphodiesterase class I)